MNRPLFQLSLYRARKGKEGINFRTRTSRVIDSDGDIEEIIRDYHNNTFRNMFRMDSRNEISLGEDQTWHEIENEMNA